MLKMLRRGVAIGLAVVLAVGVWPATPARALGNCSANTNVSEMTTGSTAEVEFGVQNTDVANIRRIDVGRPSPNLSISDVSVNASGWTVSLDSSYISLAGGVLTPGATLYFTVTVAAANIEEQGSSWDVAAADGVDGSGIVECYGSQGLSIVAPPPQAPVISNLRLTGLSSTTVTISWRTDQPTQSQVLYGLTSSYGEETPLEGAASTTHSARLTGLTPNTGYQFQIYADSGNGYPGYSANTVFVTPETGTVPDSVGGAQQFPGLPVPLKAVPTESVPPTIKLETALTNPYKQAPALSGVATDNEAVAGIYYSTDGGSNWLLAEKAAGLGGKRARFSFTPLNLDDGNYRLMVRAVDTSGNTSQSGVVTLVIDRLPPQVGGSVVSVGAQVLQPDATGTIAAIAGVEQRISFSAVGGPTEVTMAADSVDGRTHRSFVMSQSADTGLWSGGLSLDEAGEYVLTAQALDGAGNRTSRRLGGLRVRAPARLVDSAGKPLQGAVTVYCLSPESNEWSVWEGASYGQQNPQTSASDGTVKLMLPAGSYYLRATAAGRQSVTSNIVTLDRPTPITDSLQLRPAVTVRLGLWRMAIPSLVPHHLSLQTGSSGSASGTESLVGKDLATINLATADGTTTNSVDWLGKPTVVTLLASWSPATSEQLAALSALQANGDVNVAPIALQEKAAKIQVYTAIAGYRLNWVADPDGAILAQLPAYGLPTHYFVDRKGVIRRVVSGVLSEAQLADGLGGI